MACVPQALAILSGFFFLGFGLRSPPKEIAAVAANITSLQIRSGQLSSYKGLSLQRSPWPIYAHRTRNADANQTIGFYRIVGNNLPPRHDNDQLHRNIRYILQHEPDLPRVRKIFVLNRLNASLENEITQLIKARGHEVFIIQFDIDEYRPHQIPDTYGLHPSDWGDLLILKFSQINQNLYVINNNGARNAALRDGIKRGWAWTLPFDGNSFFTRAQWDVLVNELDVSARAGIKYAAVPMVRTAFTEKTSIHTTDAPPGLVLNSDRGEPQVAFSRSAEIRFNPMVPYGHRPKVDLLWRLGLPGAWDAWNHDTVFRAEGKCSYLGRKKKAKPPSVCKRTLPPVDVTAAKATVLTQAVIYRLPDLRGQLASVSAHGDNYKSRQERRNLRDLAVSRKIEEIDAIFPPSVRGLESFVKPLFFNMYSMESMRRECVVHENEMRDRFSSQSGEHLRPSIVPLSNVNQHHCTQIRSLIQLAKTRLNLRDMAVDKSNTTMRQVPRNRFVCSTRYHLEGSDPFAMEPFAMRPSHSRYDVDSKDIQSQKHQSERISSVKYTSSSVKAHMTKMLGRMYRRQDAKERFPMDESASHDGSNLGLSRSEACEGLLGYYTATNITMYALAHFYSGNRLFSDKAARLLRTRFLDQKTPILPTIEAHRWSPSSSLLSDIWKMRDLIYTLDALAMVRRTNSWSNADDYRIRNWCEALFHALTDSPEIAMEHDYSAWYALQLVAVARCARPERTENLRAMFHARVDRWIMHHFDTGDAHLRHNIRRTGAFRNHAFASYAMILTWRGLLNFGAPVPAAKIAKILKRSVSVFNLTLTWPRLPQYCAIHMDARAHANRSRLVLDICAIGRRTALELATPLCQWVLDYDPNLAEACSMCQRWGSVGARSLNEATQSAFPTAFLEKFYWPPLVPSETSVFPFQNLMW